MQIKFYIFWKEKITLIFSSTEFWKNEKHFEKSTSSLCSFSDRCSVSRLLRYHTETHFKTLIKRNHYQTDS